MHQSAPKIQILLSYMFMVRVTVVKPRIEPGAVPLENVQL